MTESRRVVLLADESASWRIAGLRQIDRLLLGIDEWARTAAAGVEVSLWWKPGMTPLEVELPSRVMRVRLARNPNLSPAAAVLSTHVVFRRRELRVADLPLLGEITDWDTAAAAAASCGACFVPTEAAIGRAERWLLSGSGKPADGFASRFVNRPISRRVTSLLLRTSLTPNQWNLLLLIFPIAACWLLVRGDYASVVWAFVLFNCYSILDGCDGEIARARFLESKRGAQLDTWCDVATSVAMLLLLGVGLANRGPFLAIEGAAAAFLTLMNEVWLARASANDSESSGAIYARHHELLSAAAVLSPGRRSTAIFVQLTKRDVATWFFLLLALIARPEWVLHLSFVVAVAVAMLAIVGTIRRLIAR